MKIKLWVCGIIIGLGGLAGLRGADQGAALTNGRAPNIRFDGAPLPQEVRRTTSLAPIVSKVAASVVTVYSTKKVTEEVQLPFNDPMLRRFFGGGGKGSDEERGLPRERTEHGLGSGVIVSPDGYILSNSHVVEDAQEIKIRFSGGGPELDAKVIGVDPPTDLAVLKVDLKTNLVPITIADSASLQVGDMVMAVGNPFGVGQTVTVGIVSAMGRGGFGIVDYEDFIQTDASINPGNSGGALVDAQGRLVGVPTAILSRTGGSMGIGFAVPSSLARTVMDRIIKDGRVVRGHLGVFVQPVSAELAKVFQLPDTSGALVSGVTDNSPALKAGLQPGDVILEMDGKKVPDARSLRLLIAQSTPNTPVKLKILREGKERTIEATLMELPTEPQTAKASEQPERPPARRPEGLPGVQVADLSSRVRQQLEIPAQLRGVLVVDVAEESPASEAGLHPGDVIQEINKQRVRNAREAVEIGRKSRETAVLLRVWSKGANRFLVIQPKLASK